MARYNLNEILKKRGMVSRPATSEEMDLAALNKLLCEVLEEQADTDEMYASELKGVLMRLRPTAQMISIASPNERRR